MKRYTTPSAITATAPAWPMASLAKPMNNGNTVPPNRPIIIRPEISFCLLWSESKAWLNTNENMLELP